MLLYVRYFYECLQALDIRFRLPVRAERLNIFFLKFLWGDREPFKMYFEIQSV